MSTADCEENWNVKDVGIDFWPMKIAAMERKWKLPTTASFFLSFFSKRERFKQSDAHLFIEIPGTERRHTPDKGQRNPPRLP